MTEEEYLKDRLEDQINWYSNKSSACQKQYKKLRLIEMTAAALIPFLSGMGETLTPVGAWLIGILGVMIAVSNAISALYKYHENWIEYRATSELLKHEKYLYLTACGEYADGDRFRNLVQRVEILISKENATWSQVASQKQEKPIPPEARNQQVEKMEAK